MICVASCVDNCVLWVLCVARGSLCVGRVLCVVRIVNVVALRVYRIVYYMLCCVCVVCHVSCCVPGICHYV